MPFRETEEKRDLEFRKDGEEVYYKNYKRYVFDQEHSCDGCKGDDLFTIPNGPALVGFFLLKSPPLPSCLE